MLGFLKGIFVKSSTLGGAAADDPAKPEEWILRGVNYENGDKKVFRIRSRVPVGIEAKDFSCCVIIDWPLAGQLPESDETAVISEFEDHVDALDDRQGNSVLMHVVTGAGKREWCYYSKSYPKFIEQLNGLLEKKPRYPLSIEYQERTDWRYWRKLLEFVEAA